MPINLSPYLEALQMLQYWSSVLLAIQTGLLIALLFITAQLGTEISNTIRTALIITVINSAISVLIGLNVIGTIPWSTQNLLSMVIKYHDIYQFQNYIGIPIWIIAFGQHIFFFLSIVSLVFYIYALLSEKKKYAKV